MIPRRNPRRRFSARGSGEAAPEGAGRRPFDRGRKPQAEGNELMFQSAAYSDGVPGPFARKALRAEFEACSMRTPGGLTVAILRYWRIRAGSPSRPTAGCGRLHRIASHLSSPVAPGYKRRDDMAWAAASRLITPADTASAPAAPALMRRELREPILDIGSRVFTRRQRRCAKTPVRRNRWHLGILCRACQYNPITRIPHAEEPAQRASRSTGIAAILRAAPSRVLVLRSREAASRRAAAA